VPSKTVTYDGYIRVSRVNGRKGASYRSPGDQRMTIERLAREKGLTLGEIVQEEDVSGGKKTEEREIGRLVQKIKDGESGGIIVWNVKRYSRNWADGLMTFDSILTAEGRLIAEDFDQVGMGARSILSFHLETGQRELEEKRATWKRAVDAASARGAFVGITPVGFDRLEDSTLKQNEDAKVVREVFLARARGVSWNRLAEMLEEAGVKTATGSPRWNINSVRSMIGHEIYKGSVRNGVTHHFPEYAVVTPSEWDRAQPVGTAPRRDPGKYNLLGALVFCSGCGHRMSPSQTVRAGRTYRYLKCQNRSCSGRARADYGELETLVVESAVSAFEEIVRQGVRTGRETDVERVTALEQEIEDAKARRRAAAVVLDASDPEDVRALEGLAQEVEDAKAALTDELGTSERIVSVAEWQAAWDVAGFEERREALAKIVERVTVSRVGSKWAEGTTADEMLSGEGETVESKALEDRVRIEYRY
jgi:hypothetical protein